MKELLKIFVPFIGRNQKLNLLLNLQSKAYESNQYIIMKLINSLIYKHFHCDISPKAKIGKGTRFPHPLGIVIGEGVIIGDNTTIYQNVTIGRATAFIDKYPTIEDKSIIYANSIIIGDITLKKGTQIGAHSLVNQTTIANGIYRGIPSKLIRLNSKD